ncbi:MAG: TonB-dependent receptor [Gemmatimonadaceae bacterium]|nr:TonB-dependent receptor [Gemmatimonadaceae bacterium]
MNTFGRRFSRWSLASLAAAAGLAISLGAQTTTGSVRGYVRDPAGNPLADAQISARSVDMGLLRGTVSNTSGFYNLPGLRPGPYEISIRRLGFAAQTRAVTVSIGQTITLEFRMQQTATQIAGVVVTADATEKSRTSEIGTNVSRDQIRDLPSADRNFLDLTRLVPGITQGAVNSSDKVFAAGGQAPEAVNLFVDGATYKNDILRGGVAGQDASKGNPFPQGAVQEFRVVTQNYKAEYQKASSAIITATTRSGGIAWEGEAFGLGIGKSLVAKDAFTARQGGPDPDYSRVQGGASIGGPIIKDKLFFFGTYELNSRKEPQNVFLGGDAARAPASLNLSQYTGQFSSTFREHLGFGKLTYAQSERSTFDVSTTIRNETDFRGFGGQTSFEASENVAISVYTGVANWKYAGDRWLNEAQVNTQFFTWNPTWTNGDLVGKNYFGILRVGGKDSEQNFKQNRISLRDDLTRSGFQMGGDHVIKMGASLDFLGYEANKRFNANPVFNFRSDENWSRPFEAFFGFGDPKVKTNNTQFGAYIQDDWAISQKLVLNLGLRWDIETNMINNSYVTPQALRDSLAGPLSSKLYVDQPFLKADGSCCDVRQVRVIDQLGGLSNFVTSGRSDRKPFLGAFQPRLGFSYDVLGTGRTVLFGGAGIYYDRNYWNTLLDESFRRQYSVLRVGFNATGPTTSCPQCVAWDNKYLNPATLRTLAGTAGLPEVFLVANDLKPPKTYQMSGGIRQGIGEMLLTASYNGVRGFNGMNFVHAAPWGGLGPNYSTLFITDGSVKTWYDALQLQLDRPLRANTRWGGALAYTLARADEQGQSQDIFWGFDDHFPLVKDIPRRRAPNNQTHTIVANAITRLPWGVQFSSIVSLGSGLTVNATDASAGWDYGKQKKYVYSPPTKPFLGIGHVFNTQNMDARVEKSFGFASGQSISVLLDLFNAFNTANWGCYDAQINPTSGDRNANYNKPGCAALGRRVQIGMRYGLLSARKGGM